MNEIFSRIFINCVPDFYRYRCCIAGGAAFDFSSAGDIDLFIYQITTDTALAKLKVDLIAMNIPGIEFSNIETETEYVGPSHLIATVRSGLMPDIQIIASECFDIKDLLRNFDLSTHCVAYSPEGIKYTIRETTDRYTAPKIVCLRNPDKTLVRYRKLVLRYDLPVDLPTIGYLVNVRNATAETPVYSPV